MNQVLNQYRRQVQTVGILALVMLFLCNSLVVSAQTTPTINKSSLAMYIGDTNRLVVSGTEREVTYESLDTSVVTVDTEGLVTAIGVGDTYILADTGTKILVCYVVVKSPQISKSKVTVYMNGITEQLTVHGSNGGKVTWTSKDENIAKVTAEGEVIAVGIGQTTVQGTLGKSTYYCKVTVKAPYIKESSIYLTTGKKYQINLVGSKGIISYKSSNEAIAKVSSKGWVTGLKEGNTVITAKYRSKTYKVKVSVADNRLSVSTNQIWLNQNAELSVTFKDRKASDGVTITDEQQVVRINTSKWSGNTLKITLEPVKTGKSELVITRNGSTESVKVKVIANVKHVMTAEEIYETYAKSTVSIISHDAGGNEKVGSGFFIGSGIVVTNYHVIEYANDMYMEDYTGKKYQVKYLYDYDVKKDLAVLGVEESNEEILFLSKDKATTGEEVFTLGSPVELTGSISDGIVSYAKRYMEGIEYIQFTAPISKSSGGGPLLNIYGEVIGVNTLTVSSGQNLNFAVTIRYLKELDFTHKKDIRSLYEENKDKVIDTSEIIIIG